MTLIFEFCVYDWCTPTLHTSPPRSVEYVRLPRGVIPRLMDALSFFMDAPNLVRSFSLSFTAPMSSFRSRFCRPAMSADVQSWGFRAVLGLFRTAADLHRSTGGLSIDRFCCPHTSASVSLGCPEYCLHRIDVRVIGTAPKGIWHFDAIALTALGGRDEVEGCCGLLIRGGGASEVGRVRGDLGHEQDRPACRWADERSEPHVSPAGRQSDWRYFNAATGSSVDATSWY